jgi:putative ABC transport system permease protein
MKYVNLILSGLFRKKLRTGLTLLSLIAAFTLLGLLQAVNSLFGGAADFLGASRLITQASTSFTQPLPMRMLPQIEPIPGVKAVSHSQFFGGIYQDARSFFPQFAVNPQRLRETYSEWVMPEDNWRQFVSTRDGAIVGRQLADQFGWKVGDIVPLNSFIWTKADGSRVWEWRIVGIFDGRDKEWSERAGLMYLNYGQFDEGRSPSARGLAGVFIVYIDDPNEAGRIAAEIDAKFDNSSDETKTQSEQEFQLGFLRQFGDIGLIVNLITAAVFFSILFLTGVSMSQAVRERIPELAVLKCLGFTDRQVMWLVLAEAFALCLIGALVGMLLASAVTVVLPPEFPVKTDLQVWAIAGASVIVLTLMVGMPPALTAQRLKIVDALAGRGDDSPLERLLHRGLSAVSTMFGKQSDDDEDDTRDNGREVKTI